jgi:hypothetical protein
MMSNLPKEVAAPLVVAPADEWMPFDTNAAEQKLQAWAEATGGQRLSGLFAESEDSETDKEDSRNLGIGIEDIGWRLLLVAVIYWPIEIALRREWLPWQ